MRSHEGSRPRRPRWASAARASGKKLRQPSAVIPEVSPSDDVALGVSAPSSPAGAATTRKLWVEANDDGRPRRLETTPPPVPGLVTRIYANLVDESLWEPHVMTICVGVMTTFVGVP